MSSKASKSLHILWKQPLAVRNLGGFFLWKVILEYNKRKQKSYCWPLRNCWNPSITTPVEIASCQKHFTAGIRRDILFSNTYLLCIHLNWFFWMISSITPRCHCLWANPWLELVARGKCLWSWLCSLHRELWVSYQLSRDKNGPESVDYRT